MGPPGHMAPKPKKEPKAKEPSPQYPPRRVAHSNAVKLRPPRNAPEDEEEDEE